MFKNYLKIAFRNIKKSKSYSFINIVGFAVGIAVFIMICLYIEYELSYDKHYQSADRIYQMIANDNAKTPGALAPTLLKEFPEVEAATRLSSRGDVHVRYQDKAFLENHWVWADEHFLDVFNLPFIKGDKNTALDNPYSMIISEETAEKIFRSEDPINKVLNISFRGNIGEMDYLITGVFKKIPKNSYIKGDYFVNLKTLETFLGAGFDDWKKGLSVDTFILLREKSDHHLLAEKYQKLLASAYKVSNSSGYHHIRLTDLHLRSSSISNHFDLANVSDIRHIYLFAAIGLIILSMACVNYLNLATARSLQRGKEVGMRKVMGAFRFQLIRQFLGESLLVTSLALIMASVMTYLLLPVFNNIVKAEGSIQLFQNIEFFFALVILILLIGILSGLYPAFFMSRLPPVKTLKGSSATKPEGLLLRNVLVVVQFSVSVILLICTLITSKQLNYLTEKKLGFSKEHVIMTGGTVFFFHGTLQAFKEELLKYPDINNVTFSQSTPMQITRSDDFYYQNIEEPGDYRLRSYYTPVDYDYIDLFDMEIIKGRNFNRVLDNGKEVYIINETLCQQLGWDNPIGKQYGAKKGKGTVIGVVKDFHNDKMYTKIGPVTLFLVPYTGTLNSLYVGTLISIKINSTDLKKTLSNIEAEYNKYSHGYPFEYSFMNEEYNKLYKSEIQRGRMFEYFSMIAIVICCLGLFGLASFSVEKSVKEIGIRKVLGASVPELLKMFLWKYMKWVIIANLMAYPVAYFFMNSWLQDFAYRTNMSLWIFLFASLLTVLIAFITVISQSFKAAQKNPVESLKYES